VAIQLRTEHSLGRMSSPAAEIKQINDEVALWHTSLNVSWSQIKTILRGKIAEASLTGGITTYTLNGRTVSVSLDWLEKALAIAVSNSGGRVVVEGEFGS
jgi:hypothetical protein